MDGNTTINITLLIAIIGGLIGVFSFVRSITMGTQENAYAKAKTDTKLDNIAGLVSEIRVDQKSQNKAIEELGGRVTIIEQSVKSAHHRIDRIEKEEKKDD